MKVSDILAHLRTRLGDENDQFAKFSDSFLVDLIYIHQNKLLSEFECNITSFERTLKETDKITLDFEILKLITAFLNNNPLNLVSFAYALKNNPINNLFFYELDSKNYGFSHKVSGDFKLYAVKKAILNTADDELMLDDTFSNLLVYTVILDCLKTKITPDNSQRIAIFENIVKLEKKEIIALLSRKRGKSSFKSPFIGMI